MINKRNPNSENTNKKISKRKSVPTHTIVRQQSAREKECIQASSETERSPPKSVDKRLTHTGFKC